MSIDQLFDRAKPQATAATIAMKRPDDWHVHLRDGAMLKAVLPFTSAQFARGIIMPNLVPPPDDGRRRRGLSAAHSRRAACRF